MHTYLVKTLLNQSININILCAKSICGYYLNYTCHRLAKTALQSTLLHIYFFIHLYADLTLPQ